ncbi:MAG: hypothetical protein LKG48_05005 [Lachnospiraceae bacterium]|nr:hypothetical protein [Lachnospiraceae bacterium]MCH4104233.1 hypothetical protein [Lachnospiraceae bacterium]MCI1309106.1 hypothetical protein [Lachnospiraceae bacterium]MCI1356982.1 hypothetical protein [Lachnospiraceae bacterium]
MAITVGVINADEKTWQGKFYETLFGNDYLEGGQISVDRSTDGYTRGILFEHKQNVQSYGESKALSQALIYLCRFNRDGVPVPAKICLVGQDEQTCYIYDTQNYMDYINDIPAYANLKASDGIPNFAAGARSQKISFDMSSAVGMQDILKFVQQAPKTVKVKINAHNVYGWSQYYYDHAPAEGQKAEKKAFFQELRNPRKTLAEYIEPWMGQETDFKYIMDMLNDPMTQKKLGAFYTPPEYAKLSAALVRKAIKRIPAGNDYVVIDTCAGGGNLEMYLDDGGEDVLSHVIVSTYELKEWMVLKDRFGKRVRYIVPPIPKDSTKLPALNKDGFLSGANALTRDIIDNPEVKKYIDDPHCNVIVYINPPYIETTGIEFQKKNEGKKASSWKNSWMVQEMKKEVSGAATNDMGNVFIWQSFKYFMKLHEDSLIVFSPVKYWKAQHLVKKKFMEGYAFNRKHFHAPTPACVMCAWWSNEDDPLTDRIELQAVDLDENRKYVFDKEKISVKQIHSLFSDRYYDNRKDAADTHDGIVCELNGLESNKSDRQISVLRNWNSNIIGYMLTKTSGFDNPRLSSNLLVAGKYDGHGFYLRSDNFLEKLPCFAASRYTDYCNDWKVMSMVMKSGDKATQYEADVKSGRLNVFLFHCLFWTCMSHYPHMRSLHGSDGRLYLNQLCFDGNTLARQKLDEFLAKGYKLTEEEQTLWNKMQALLEKVKTDCTDEYRPEFTYGLYQIDEEINVKIPVGTKADGTPKMEWKYGDLNNMIKDIKALDKQYYLDNLVDTLFEYEFLK